MKPRYTVRLTGELVAAEREQVAQRVAGITDIEADKIVRLLERGKDRDLIKPSSANVANRLASVLAEAGAPVQLVAVEDDGSAGATVAQTRDVAGDQAQDDVLRPRAPDGTRDEGAARGVGARAGAQAKRPGERDEDARVVVSPDEGREERQAGQEAAAVPGAATPTPPTPEVYVHEAAPREAGPSHPASSDAAPEAPELRPGASRAEADAEADVGAVRDAKAAPPPPVDPPTHDPNVERVPEPGQTTRDASLESAEAPEVAARSPRPREPQPIEHPLRPARQRNGTAFLGAVGAAALGIGAILAMDFLLAPIVIGVLVLAALALVLSIAGQRRAIWLPGLGALALLVWGLVNAEGGPVPSLASNWPWFAMFAGAILLVLAGAQEAQRRRRV